MTAEGTGRRESLCPLTSALPRMGSLWGPVTAWRSWAEEDYCGTFGDQRPWKEAAWCVLMLPTALRIGEKIAKFTAVKREMARCLITLWEGKQ